MSGPKLGVLAAWIFGAACLVLGVGGMLGTVGRGLFWLLVVVHGIECAYFLPRLRQAGGPLSQHLVQTFLFGVLHVRELSAQDAEAGV